VSVDIEIEEFVKNGGKINHIPTSNTPPKAKKIRQFTLTDMEQVVNFININGESSTRDVSLYLDINYPKLKCILSYAEELGKIESNVKDKVQYWKVKKQS